MRRASLCLTTLCLLWAGCAWPPVPPIAPAAPPTATNTPAIDTPASPTATSSPSPITPASPSATDVSPGPGDCGWAWATQPLPELTAQVQAALDAAGIPGASARAYAFGENCLDPTGAVRYFAAMETDIDIRLEGANLQDLEALGDLAGQVLAVLEAFPPEDTPGTQPGRIGLIFASGGVELTPLYVTVEQAEQARARGLTGTALLEALGFAP